MGFLTKPIKNLDDLFVHTLQDILYAEQRITKALPKMIQKVSDPQLQEAFRSHLEETKGQIKRLEQVFQMHQAEAKRSIPGRGRVIHVRPRKSLARSARSACRVSGPSAPARIASFSALSTRSRPGAAK